MRQCGVEHVDKLVVEGQWREEVPAEVLLATGPARGAAGRRAHRAQLPRPPLRHRHPHRPLRRGGRRNRRPHPRHPQDDAGAAGAGEGRGRGGRRQQPPPRPLRRDPDQGEPHRPRRRRRQGRLRRPARPSPSCRSRSRCRNLDEAAYALGVGADRLLLDNMDLETLRGAVKLRDENAGGPTAPALEASGGVDLEHRPRDRRDRRRLHLHRRPHPLGPQPGLQPPARTRLGRHVFQLTRSGRAAPRLTRASAPGAAANGSCGRWGRSLPEPPAVA